MWENNNYPITVFFILVLVLIAFPFQFSSGQAFLATDTPIVLDSVGAINDQGQSTSTAIGTDGFPVISYYHNTGGSLNVIHCTSTDCSTFDTPIVLDSIGNSGFFSSIAIGTDSFPVISYHDASIPGLQFIHCTRIGSSFSSFT